MVSTRTPTRAGSAPPTPADASDALALAICHAWRQPAAPAPSASGGLTPAQRAWAEAEKAVVANLDLVPFANSNAPSIGNGAEFNLSEGDVDPSSIRMLG